MTLGNVLVSLVPGSSVPVDDFVVEVEELEEEYEVAEISGHRRVRGSYMFLTRYAKFSECPTWQPLENFCSGHVISNAVLKKYCQDHNICQA